MDRYRHLELFLRNRLAKPSEGRNFRTHGIAHPGRKPMARKRLDWVEVVIAIATVIVFVLVGFMLGSRG